MPLQGPVPPGRALDRFARFLLAGIALALAPLYAEAAPSAGGLPEARLLEIRDGFDQRVRAIFEAHRGRPLKRGTIKPPLGPGRVEYSRDYAFSLVAYAARCLVLGESDAQADAALGELADYFLAAPGRIHDADNFHWHADAQLRLLELFGSRGSRRSGAITPATEGRMLETVWLYAKRRDEDATRHTRLAVADHEQSRTWFIIGSENHHAQSFTTLWHFARIAKDRDEFRHRRYDDGATAAEHHARWSEYAKLYLLERARKAFLVEMMSADYNALLLKGVFNLHDFAEDPELKRRARLFLDLYFAYWGQEQINGISGGGRARLYRDIAVKPAGLGHLFFGLGASPGLRCDLLTAMLSDYRPPLVVVDIACDLQGKGAYEVVQRPLGLAAAREYHSPPVYRLRTDYGGLLRYSYCTPDFVIGTAMCEARPEPDWTMISSQNRRHGVIFAGHPHAAILPQCEITRDARAYNAQWSLQRKGTLVIQKLRTAKNAGATRTWFSKDGLSAPVEEAGWVFVESAGAFAAVRTTRGGARWAEPDANQRGRWLVNEDAFAPVVIEVMRKSEIGSFAAFRHAVLDRPAVEVREGVLRFRGVYGDEFEFFADSGRKPAINGRPVDYAPALGLDSPWLQSAWDSGVVTLAKHGRREVLDFRRPSTPPPAPRSSS